MAAYKWVCAHCGSENVRRDAWGMWDVETQVWELASVFDAAFCDDCEGEASLIAIEIAAAPDKVAANL